MRTLMLAVLACLFAACAVAQDASDLIGIEFAPGEPIEVTFMDNVTDGCLPRPNAIQTTIELNLRRAGLKPTNERASWALEVTALGYEVTYIGDSGSGYCVVALLAEFAQKEPVRPALIRKFDVQYQVKSGMQIVLREVVGEMTDDFAKIILGYAEK